MGESEERLKKPYWLKVKMPNASRFKQVREVVKGAGVRTVCDASQCPNISDCWGQGNATFLILGDVCTRACKFCAVTSGDPNGMVDEKEPEGVARAVKELGVKHAVITSVTRDDLEDGGAGMFARTVSQIRSVSPSTRVELLIPDFNDDPKALHTVVSSAPDLLGHNLEVVRGLQTKVRDLKASFAISLKVLRTVKQLSPTMLTKTSLMLGLGESHAEVLETMKEARMASVDIMTLGQYLKPRGGSLQVERYIEPSEFEELRAEGERLGFRRVLAGPFVRSSYHAHEIFD